ncbi:MAG TPA: hypothetical protein VF294_18495, partial [Polyangiaceae bacterium]
DCARGRGHGQRRNARGCRGRSRFLAGTFETGRAGRRLPLHVRAQGTGQEAELVEVGVVCH